MTDDGLPDEMAGTFYDFHQALTTTEDLLKPYLSLPLDEMYDVLTPIEQAKSELITAYTVNSLFWAFLTTQGCKLEGHALKKEMERIQKYMRKVKLLESHLKGVTPPTGHNVPKTQQIDKFAAARFIKRGLGKEEKLANKKQKTDKESSSS